jgi:signal transduction histidine kinase/CheY-like chemotaxis protein/HPt (histidine-containing phosphotransfer) domain-containing protein
MLPVLSLIYAAAAILFLIVPPFQPNSPHVLVLGIASALVLLTWAVMRVDDPRFDTPISVTTISIAAGVGLTMFAVSGALSNTTTLAISIVAAGALLYRFSTYAFMVVLVFIGWIPLAWGHPTGAVSLAAFHLWAATVVGALVLWSRRELMFKLHDEAEEAVSVRQLATEQAASLELARDAALASAQAKGQFLANVSHEVRTPLNGILGLLQLIDPRALPQRERDYLREVNKSAGSLLAIVNDLLDLSKIEAGEMRLESVPFDMVGIIEDIAVNYASAAHAKGIELLTEVDDDVPTELCGDPLRLRQVISNLVNNALKFTKHGEVVIAVRKIQVSRAYATVQFRVSDTGVGISKDGIESIFRPFSQADASTTREYGGTGLGLPICRQLVQLMGGSLHIETEVGKGSTFFFDARFELEERLSEDLKAVTDALGGMRVLVLESNGRARETLEAQLERWGMNPSSVANYDGAKRAFKEPPFPNIALIDLRSLGSDWRNRTCELSKAANLRGAAVIAVCSHKHEVSELEDAEIFVHVEKPIRRTKVIAALLAALNRQNSLAPLLEQVERNSLPAPAPRALSANGMRVLVAEDNSVNQKVVQAHLHALGYEVDIVGDGVAALDALRGGHDYAAVIMDGQMPHMDGYEATRRQRERELEEGTPRVPIIALTAHAMQGDRSTAFAAGMDDYLSKPFTQKQLEQALLRWASQPVANAVEYEPEALDTSVTSQLLELEEDEPGFLCEVIDSFFMTADESLERMKTALAEGDLKALRAAAHMVRGGSQQLGARRVGATCAKLETTTQSSDAGPLVDALHEDLEGARIALTNLADRALDAAS